MSETPEALAPRVCVILFLLFLDLHLSLVAVILSGIPTTIDMTGTVRVYRYPRKSSGQNLWGRRRCPLQKVRIIRSDHVHHNHLSEHTDQIHPDAPNSSVLTLKAQNGKKEALEKSKYWKTGKRDDAEYSCDGNKHWKSPPIFRVRSFMFIWL